VLPYALASPKCPEIGLFDEVYAKPDIPKTEWNNPVNAFISVLESFHMIRDEIVAEGQSVVVTAKFDYGRIIHKDLEDEIVKFYIRGRLDNDWRFLEEAVTDGDGKASITLNPMTAGQYRLYAGVPPDGTGTEGYLSVIQSGLQAVVFDIDGTISESDAGVIGDYTGIDPVDPKDGAQDLVTSYLDLDYLPVYVTARQYWYAKGSRAWLKSLGLPPGILRCAWDLVDGVFFTAEYKLRELEMFKDQGIEFVRAYGNAKTDSEAFIRANIGESNTFSIGEDAGYYGTTPIPGNTYVNHISEMVENYPPSQCN